MIDTAFPALVRAWITTMIATSLIATAVALSRVWDTAIYLQGLQQALALTQYPSCGPYCSPGSLCPGSEAVGSWHC
jgi:hypothetical protein